MVKKLIKLKPIAQPLVYSANNLTTGYIKCFVSFGNTKVKINLEYSNFIFYLCKRI
jgi:hypothetical protein